MADPISIIASALTIGASAAQLSLALFSVVQTLKNAPQEIAEIADEMSLLAGSLQTLGDILDAHRNLCKPALFKNTHLIILRYKQVAGEIRILINKPDRLAGLKWALNKSKAKGLLKKVEGIKTALILELNIVLLAREEFNRYLNFESNAQFQNSARFNRYRRVVESTVQANRQVVESAQQEDEKFEADTRRYTSAEVDVWKKGSSDTATWLYHLVFSSEDAGPPTPNPQTQGLHQASVTDESAETTARSTHSPSSEAAAAPKRRSSGPSEKAMILWSRQTEPGLVVDRLLFSWTTLSSEQIGLSSTRHDGVEGIDDDNWREGILKMVEEAKKEDGLSFAQWEQLNEPVGSADEAFQSAEEDSTIGVNKPTLNFRNNAQSVRKRNTKKPDRTDSWAYTDRLSPAYSDSRPKRDVHEPRVKWQQITPPISRSTPHLPKQRRHTEEHRPVDDEVRRPTSRVHTIHSDQTDSVFSPPNDDFNYNKATSGYFSPFAPGYNLPPVTYGFMPPWREPVQGPPVPSFHQEPPRQAYASADRHWSYSSPPPSPPPAAAPSPPSLLPNPVQPANIQPTVPEQQAQGNAVLAAVEKLLEKRNQESQVEYEHLPFSRLAQILQEREVQSERERANATTEAFVKQMQEAREKDGERMQQLESLVADQRAEQRRLEIAWERERKTLEAKAAKQAQEVRDSAAVEITAAKLAKEAAQIALHVEKLETEKEARQRADARVVEERTKTDDGHKLQLQRYEELVRGLQEQQQKLEQDNDRPVRRTRIAEGNRSMDITEYVTGKRAFPLASSSPSLQDSFARLDMRSDRATSHWRPQRRSRHDSFRSSTASLQSSRTSLGNTGTSDPDSRSQQMIVFPGKADRRSQKIAELQASLAGYGIDSVFEDPEELQSPHFGQLIPYKYNDTSDQVVRSTIFWEASALSLGSELLMTMKQAGWKPTYTRISGKGQTHYLGSQPVHTYFFSPDYKPQFCPSTKGSTNESITIQKALVEEYALIELGFEFQTNETGLYILDGRLTYSDIETLLERSFLIKENNHRRLHRQLQWHYDKDPKAPLSPYPETYAPSLPSASSVYSGENSTVYEDTDTETHGKKSSDASGADQSDIGDVSNFLVPRSGGSRKSGAPSSVASRTSKSTNPWGKYMKTTENSGTDNSPGLSGSVNLID